MRVNADAFKVKPHSLVRLVCDLCRGCWNDDNDMSVSSDLAVEVVVVAARVIAPTDDWEVAMQQSLQRLNSR